MKDGAAVRLVFLTLSVTVITLLTVGVFSAGWARYKEDVVLSVPTGAGNTTFTLNMTARMGIWGIYTCMQANNGPKMCNYTSSGQMVEGLRTISDPEFSDETSIIKMGWMYMQLGTVFGEMLFIAGCLLILLFFYRKSAGQKTRTYYMCITVIVWCISVCSLLVAVILDILIQIGLYNLSEVSKDEETVTRINQMITSPQWPTLTSHNIEIYFPWTLALMLLAICLESALVGASIRTLWRRNRVTDKTVIKYSALMSEEDEGKLEFTDAVEEA